MILTCPPDSAPIDQGDIIDDCPVSVIESYDGVAGAERTRMPEQN
jgi:hypothetical protein